MAPIVMRMRERCIHDKHGRQPISYNNYRVCSKHFASHMFLNDLRNRLQPHHTVLSTVFNITNEEGTT